MKTKLEELTAHLAKMDHFTHFEVKAIDDKERTVEGWASTEDIDRINDVVKAEAFTKTLKDFMSNPVLTYMHNLRAPIGHVVDAEVVKGKGLFVKVFVDSTEEDIWTKVKEKTIRAFSFGWRTLKDHTETIKKNGGSVELRVIDELELIEVALVSVPMNRRALFSAVKSFARPQGIDLVCEGGCKDCGECLESYRKSMIDGLESKALEDEVPVEKEETTQEPDENENEKVVGEISLSENEKEYYIEFLGNEFNKGSFRDVLVKVESPQVFAVVGRIKGKKETELQAIKFSKNDWTSEDAEAWLKEDLIKELPEEARHMYILNCISSDEVIAGYSYDDEEKAWNYTVVKSKQEPGSLVRKFRVTATSEDGFTFSETESTYQEGTKAGQVLSAKNKKRLNNVVEKILSATSGLNIGLEDLKTFMADHSDEKPGKTKKSAEPKGAEPEEKKEDVVLPMEDISNMFETEVKVTKLSGYDQESFSRLISKER